MNNPSQKLIDLRYVDPEDWQHFIEQGGTLSDALDIKKDELEAMYTLAYQKYQNGNFKEALSVFQLLCHCNHFEAKYVLGLGATHQALKHYKLAAETYGFAAFAHPKDPRFPYHAAECHLALDNWRVAGTCFEMALDRSQGDQQHKILHEKAQRQFDILETKLISEENQKKSQEDTPS